MPFSINKTEIEGVLELMPQVFTDERGAFAEMFKASELESIGEIRPVVQVNQSWNKRSVLRGLHYQKPPAAQAKLVVVLTGEIVDVAVDIRVGSPSFGQSVRRGLSADKKNMLYVPEGFAHGFCVQSEEAQVAYFVFGSEYAPDAEAGIIWSDPELDIDWGTDMPVLSGKDQVLPTLTKADNPFTYTL